MVSIRFVATALISACAFAASAGAQDASVQQEIDEQVWRPFMAASNRFDADKFLSVQSKDLVRVAPDQKEVYGHERYAREIREGFERARERKGLSRQSEMRFLARSSSGDLAHETGIFRSRVTLPNGEVRTRYSRFEMILRKENGRWKILVDKDTAQSDAIGEEQFQSATPITPAR
jgi:ketosteroid isomerase-like protein